MQRSRMYLITALSIVVIVAAVFGCQGCRHQNNPNNNPQVTAALSLEDAANIVNLTADGLTAANDVVNKLEQTEPEYYAHVKPVLNRIAQANLAAINTIRLAQQGNTAANWRQSLQNVVVALGKEDLTQFGFRNPSTQALVKAGLATLVTAIQIINNRGGQ